VHPDVKAVAMVAGFNRSADMFRQEGAKIAGDSIDAIMPYISLYERIKYGEYSAYSAIQGFDNSETRVMIIQSKDDTMVLPETGYDLFYSAYSDSVRFRFIEYEDRGHNYVYYSEDARAYIEEINEQYAIFVVENGGEYTETLKAEFMAKNLDQSRFHDLDSELMNEIAEFYFQYVQ
jgi:dipeptidyl aminopeptidase/acylaminoacyl peptidase